MGLHNSTNNSDKPNGQAFTAGEVNKIFKRFWVLDRDDKGYVTFDEFL